RMLEGAFQTVDGLANQPVHPGKRGVPELAAGRVVVARELRIPLPDRHRMLVHPDNGGSIFDGPAHQQRGDGLVTFLRPFADSSHVLSSFAVQIGVYCSPSARVLSAGVPAGSGSAVVERWRWHVHRTSR